MEVGAEPRRSSSSEQTIMHQGRPKVLHRCATSLVSVALKVYRRIEDLDNFVGLLARLVAFLAGPFIGWMVQHWLFWLSLTDSIILTVEKILIYFIPTFRPIFEKIYELALLLDSLPEELDRLTIDGLLILFEKTPDLPQCTSAFRNFTNIDIELNMNSIERKEERRQLERKEEGSQHKRRAPITRSEGAVALTTI